MLLTSKEHSSLRAPASLRPGELSPSSLLPSAAPGRRSRGASVEMEVQGRRAPVEAPGAGSPSGCGQSSAPRGGEAWPAVPVAVGQRPEAPVPRLVAPRPQAGGGCAPSDFLFGDEPEGTPCSQGPGPAGTRLKVTGVRREPDRGSEPIMASGSSCESAGPSLNSAPHTLLRECSPAPRPCPVARLVSSSCRVGSQERLWRGNALRVNSLCTREPCGGRASGGSQGVSPSWTGPWCGRGLRSGTPEGTVRAVPPGNTGGGGGGEGRGGVCCSLRGASQRLGAPPTPTHRCDCEFNPATI